MTIVMAADRRMNAVMLEYDLPPMEACAEFMKEAGGYTPSWNDDPVAVWDVTDGRPRLLTSRTAPWTSRAVIERSDGLRATVELPWGASVRGARVVRLLAPWEPPEGEDLTPLPHSYAEEWAAVRRRWKGGQAPVFNKFPLARPGRCCPGRSSPAPAIRVR